MLPCHSLLTACTKQGSAAAGPSGAGDLSRSLAWCAGVWHCGVLPAGPADPPGTPQEQLPSALPAECHCEPVRQAGGARMAAQRALTHRMLEN